MYKNYNSLSTGRDTWLKNGIGGDVGSPPLSFTRSTYATWIFILMTLLFLAPWNVAKGQTVLIDPVGDGGFETGSTMALNGWTAVNAASDGWYAGAVPTPATGDRCGYVSSNTGTGWTYSQLSTYTHIYRDVTIPAGENKLTLSFKWKAGGEGTTTSDWDNLKVFVGPTTVMPTTTGPVSGASQLIGPGAISGMYKLSSAAWNNETIVFSGSPGTYRLIFSWKSDVSTIANPPAALDDVSLVSSTPSTYTSTAVGGLWNVGETWVGGIAPSSLDNAIIADGAIVTINAVSQGILNLSIGEGTSGVLNYGVTPTTFTVSGNLTVNAGAMLNAFNGTTGKSLSVAGDITNNGTINLSIGTATSNILTLNGTNVQTVGGSGTFTANIIRNLTFNNTNVAIPNINWNFNGIQVGGNLIFTAGKVALGANSLTLGTGTATGTGAAAVGSLSVTSGGFTSGKFNRYWASTGNGSTINASANPTSTGGQYPFISAANQPRSAFIDRSTSLAAGQLSCTYVDGSSMVGVNFLDGTAQIDSRYSGNWTFSTEGSGYSAVSNEVFLNGTGAYVAAGTNNRIVHENAGAGGTHQIGTNLPGAQRIFNVGQLTAAPLYIGAANADIVQPCSGAPAPGNTLATLSTVCAGSTSALSLQSATPGTGVTYQWQSASAAEGPWTNIASATNPTYVATINVSTWYRNNVTCSGETTASNPIQVTTRNFMECYQVVSATNVADEDIFNVTVGTLNNSSNCESTAPGAGSINKRYGNYRESVAAPELQRTAAVNFSLTQGTCGTDWYNNGFQVYIDYNQNAVFELSERVFNQPALPAQPNQIVTGSFIVPETALLGNTVMRVVLIEATFPTEVNYASTSYGWGETEDYTVTITEAPLCRIVSNVIASNVTVTSANIQWNAPSVVPANGYEYALSLSAMPPVSGTPNAGTSVSFNDLDPETTYFVHVRSVCETGVSYSEWITSSFRSGWCESTTTSQNVSLGYIALFQTTGGYSNISNGTTFSANGYNNYTNLFVSAQDGTSVNFSVSQNLPNYYYGLSIWVDWNNDLDFNDPGERMYSAPFSQAVQTLNGTLAVPLNTPLGNYRMRVRADYSYYTGLISACGNAGAGETEDYTLSVVEEPTCFAPTALAANDLTDSSAELSWTAPTQAPETGYEWAVTTSAVPPASGTPTVDVSAFVDSLDSNSGYYLHVRSECSEGDFSPWASKFFKTLCGSYTIPTAVEAFSALAMPDCWSTAVVTGVANWAPAASNDGVPSGRSGNFMGKAWNNSDALLISPKIDMTSADVTGARINVWIYRSSANAASDRIRFHVNTSPNLTGATQILEVFPLNSVAPTATVGWQNYTADIPQIYNTEVALYIIAQGTTSAGGSSYGIGFDDFSVENIPACQIPTGLNATNVTATTASINWTAAPVAPADGYEYYYSVSNTAPDVLAEASGSVSAGVLTAAISELNADTLYYFWVRSVCSEEVSSIWSLMGTFRTACNPTTVPYSQDFSSATIGTLPSCTTAVNAGTGNVWAVDDGDSYGQTGNALVYTYNSDNTANTWFFLQGLSLTEGVSYTVKFKYSVADAFYSENLRVAIGTSPAAAAMTNVLASYPGLVNTSATSAELTFTPTSTGVYYYGFQAYSAADRWLLLVDDIEVYESPTCYPPTALTGTANSLNSADLEWTAPAVAPEDGYEYYYSTSNTSPTIATVPSGSTAAGLTGVNVGGLTANTTYYFWVRSLCDEETTSAWSELGTFITDYCTPLYEEGKIEGDLISSLSIVGTTLSNSTGTAAVNPAYTFYTGASNLTATLQAGSSYDVLVTVGTYEDQNIAAWIDYNDDLIFDESERIGYTTTSIDGNGTATFTIVLACNADLGVHRMRVRDVWDLDGVDILPCEEYGYGETEDYLVTISSAVACPAPTLLTASATSDTEMQLGWNIGCAETSWDVHIAVAGSGTPVGGPSDPGVTNPFIVSELISGTTYEFYVRAVCDELTTSTWSGPFYFETSLVADNTTLEGDSPLNLYVGEDFTLTGTMFKEGLTDVEPNIEGETPEVEFWIGANTNNTDPKTWGSGAWFPADHNADVEENFEAYTVELAANGVGTFYVATRARIGGSEASFTYGGTNGTVGGTWNGATFANGVVVVSEIPVPENDDIADAIAISCDDVLEGFTNLATNDQPNPATFGVSNAASPNVWYTYTGSGTPEAITASLCNSDYDTAILVATGTPGNLTYIAGNEDACGDDELKSEITFESDGVTTYYIMVRGYSVSSTGRFELALSCGPACEPASTNNECATAESLDYGIVTATNNSCATASINADPTCGPSFTTFYDSWYSVNTGDRTSLRVQLTFAAPVALGFAVYSGSCGSLTQIGCSASGAMINVTDLNANTNYLIRVWSTSPAARGDFSIRAGFLPCDFVTTWNGTSWSGGAPTANESAVIAGNYSVAANLTACSLTVNNDVVVNVPSGYDFNITGAVTVAEGASLTFANNANLLQDPLAVANNNSGTITSIRNAMMIRQDYVYWASPVAGQNLLDFSPLTLPNRFYTISEATSAFVGVVPSTTDFAGASGYVVRAPNTFQPQNSALASSTPAQLFAGTFSGTPNNGTYSVPVSFSGAGLGYNLMGNPYPSPINATDFITANPGTLYFWTHTNQTTGGGANYATFNLSGGVASAAGGAQPNGFIQTGQGFLLRTGSAGTATFTNDMRVGNNDGQFFRSNIEKHRIWLNLADSSNQLNQIMVGYIEGATQGTDQLYDGLLKHSGSAISSALEGGSYVIQGRSLPFVNTDVVPLNFKADAAGSYTLSVDHVDGLFLEGQDVFLKDNLLGVVHNIKQTPYTFASDAGSFGDRFQVVYQNVTLGVENPTFDANSVVIYKQDNVLQINSGAVVMNNVKIFDIRGRLIYEKGAINANTTSLTDLKAEQQVLLVQITSEDNKMVTRKVAY